jgi:hypothetical protein
MNDVLLGFPLHHYCIGSRVLIMLMPVKVLLKKEGFKKEQDWHFAVLDYC